MNLSDATIGQVMIPVDDFDRGVAFYRDILGLPHIFSAPPQMAFFHCGAVRLLVGVLPPGQAAQRGSASLKARGVRFQAEPLLIHRTPASELLLAEFSDPDGNHLALMSEVPSAGS